MSTPRPATPADILTELHAPYALSAAQVAQYQAQGYIKLKHALSPRVLAHYGEELTAQVAANSQQLKPLAERNTYGKAFIQIGNLWQKSEFAREFVFGKRLAGLAAALMQVRGVRMYHDQALYKEAGGGFTPWHADQFYWPLSNANSVTAWIPLQAVPLAMGPLAFSVGSQQLTGGRSLEISDESEVKIGAMLKDHNLPMDEGPFDLGEVSFHAGWTYHRAGGNQTDQPRRVMTIIYIEDGIRVAQPANGNQENDLRIWFPGAKVGDVAATHMNPVMFP